MLRIALLALVGVAAATPCSVRCCLGTWDGNTCNVDANSLLPLLTRHDTTSGHTKHRCFRDDTHDNMCACTCKNEGSDFEDREDGSKISEHKYTGLATLAGVTLAAAETEQFKSDFKSAVAANLGVSSDTVGIVSISQDTGRRLLSATSVIKVVYVVYVTSPEAIQMIVENPERSFEVDGATVQLTTAPTTAPLCPASYTLPFATTTIVERTLGATASTACDISALDGRRVFGNPTINIAQAETTLGGSGDVAAYNENNPTKMAPDYTIPYLLCAGTESDGSFHSHGDAHTNHNHMAARFCELEGYTHVESIKTVKKDGDCAVYHDDGIGRRYDNEHADMISEIICSDPAAYVAPVLTCQADGSWEADSSCRCSAQDQIFNDPTVNIYALEQALGGSGDPAAYLAAKPLHAPPDSNAPYLLCAGTNAEGEVTQFGTGHTNNMHFADRFCLYHGYPGGHVSVRTVTDESNGGKGGDCAVYHNDGTGRRYDNEHDAKISQIVCVGQCM